MPRIVNDADDIAELPAMTSTTSLLLPKEVVDQFEVPIAIEMGEVPDLADLASILDPYAPAPTPAPPTDQEGHSNVTN